MKVLQNLMSEEKREKICLIESPCHLKIILMKGAPACPDWNKQMWMDRGRNVKQANFILFNLCCGFVSLQYKKTMAPNANPEPFHFFTCQPLQAQNQKQNNCGSKGE